MLQCVATSLGVVKVHGDEHRNKYNDEDEVVLPTDAFKRDRVYKCVEEVCDDSGNPCCCQSVRA